METALDRTTRALRPVIFAATLATGPIFLVSYVCGLRLMFNALPTWIFVAVGISHIIVWLAVSCLLDFQKENRSQQ